MPRLALPVLAALFAWRASAVPVEQTRYGRACLRIEARPQPESVKDAAKRQGIERALGQAGVQARWIQMVTNEGSPLIRNPYLPCDDPHADENEAILKQWVDEIHQAGMVAMSWCALSFCRSGWQAHPDWRQTSILPWPPGVTRESNCCINSVYGQALMDYCNYALDHLGLDGLWFDGSAWTEIWERPLPLTCTCAACRVMFQGETGLELPAKVDWSDATYRKWVAWRYQAFGGFIARLAGAIRAKHPDAAVVINHYHRPGIPWQSAIPLDRYPADIISGSEASAPEVLDLTMRLCRAYGRSQSEVWRPFTLDDEPPANAEPLLQHALICYAAGGQPSFGGDWFSPKMAPTAVLMTPVMNALHPFVGGRTLPYAALHVSQQSETFWFGRGDTNLWLGEPFWSSLGNWTTGLGEAHLPPEYVYDADFVPARLAPYRVLFMPLSQAMEGDQARTVAEYVRAGGIAVLGPGAGQLDAEGERRYENPLGRLLGFEFKGAPQPDGSDIVALTLSPTGPGEPLTVSGLHAPLTLRDRAWQVLFREGTAADAPPAVAVRPYGKGRAVVLSVDPAQTFGSQPVSGGKTRLLVTDEAAASGKYSLKYVDDPVVPQPFYPDLENRLAPFAAPQYSGGELNCDLKVGSGAHVAIEIRSTAPPIAGPELALGPDGQCRAMGQTVCGVPADQWVHVRIAYTFASADKPSTYEATLTLPGGEKRSAMVPTREPKFGRTDWFVIYGAGRQPATFYLDNLELAKIRPDGSRQPALSLDFEGGRNAFEQRTTLVQEIAKLVEGYVPPPLRIAAPPNVRVGYYEADQGRVLVHLHNRDARREDWQQDTGPSVVLACGFPITSAKLAVSGRPLPVRQRAGRSEVQVPPVGLYQVVEIRRR